MLSQVAGRGSASGEYAMLRFRREHLEDQELAMLTLWICFGYINVHRIIQGGTMLAILALCEIAVAPGSSKRVLQTDVTDEGRRW